MHPPAEISCQSLRLEPGQQDAGIQRVQEMLLTHPAPPLDELLVHDGNLARRAAETDLA